MNDDEELENIRRKKAEEMLQAHHRGEAPPEVLDWSFRRSNQSGFFEICQKEQMVAVTSDPNWANLVVDMLNSLTLARQVVGNDGNEL
jgi:DNA-binding TFAR19-related protein (PDSD5 family)